MVGRKPLSFIELKRRAQKYNHRNEFRVGDPSAYISARRQGLLDAVCEHMSFYHHTVEELTKKANKWTTLKEFYTNDCAAYASAAYQGILPEVTKNLKRRNKPISSEYIKQKKFKHIKFE